MHLLEAGAVVYCLGLWSGVRLAQKAARSARNFIYGKDKK